MTSTSGRPVALVTGSTGGMGRCIVADLAATHDVVALGRNADVLAELEQLDGVVAHAVDITDDTALAGVVGALGRLDVLLHVAAISVPHTVADATPQQWREHFETNVFAPAELTRLGLPLLRESQGTVIFIGSGASTKPAPGNAVYTASKHALQGMADTLRIDEATTGVRVSTIAPGPTDSGMLRAMQAKTEDGYEADHYIRPATIAAAVRYVVDAPPDAQLTDVAVRPRIELALRKDR
ncbi:SDR family oxidoreductase [Tessaracoccus antarcticus]|uniref:SDR family oxidoreductase n=1 Tax=Tessaracoccus antarcticus TaxID=2479848 RepID=A0A3M0GKK8_9ACTN|nr:SDR family oxidoreductase [Tessaracoccus antarcticus]RMB62143.1 SDR family oxidoreductase [Tessaracoccus antarcticus]